MKCTRPGCENAVAVDEEGPLPLCDDCTRQWDNSRTLLTYADWAAANPKRTDYLAQAAIEAQAEAAKKPKAKAWRWELAPRDGYPDAWNGRCVEFGYSTYEAFCRAIANECDDAEAIIDAHNAAVDALEKERDDERSSHQATKQKLADIRHAWKRDNAKGRELAAECDQLRAEVERLRERSDKETTFSVNVLHRISAVEHERDEALAEVARLKGEVAEMRDRPPMVFYNFTPVRHRIHPWRAMLRETKEP